MSKLKKIYYPILAVLALLVIILGFVSASVDLGPKASSDFVTSVRVRMRENMTGEHNSYEPDAQKTIRTTLFTDRMSSEGKDILDTAGGSKSNGYTAASFGEDPKPRYLTQEATLTQEALGKLSTEDELFYAVKTVTNFIIAIPGKTTEDAILLTANYDSAAGSESATESMQAVALLETAISYARDYAAGVKPEKTILFVFTDAEREGAYGALAFRYQFNGFNGIAQKVSLAIDFGARGTGALSVTADKISVSEVKGYASGLTEAIESPDDKMTDYDVYDCAKIRVFFGGSRDYLDTSRDTVAKLSDSKIRAVGGAMSALIDAYGFGTFKNTSAKGEFAYMGATNSYSKTVSYALGGVTLALLAVAVFLMIRSGKKVNGIAQGVIAQLMAVIISAIILYVCYFLLALLLSGFGVVPIHAITTIRYMNVGLFISSLLLAFAAQAGVFLLIRRFYKVKATDGARGAALLIMLLGIIMAFAFPTGSLGFVITALLEGVMLILTSVFAGKFKEKFGADIERLFLYTLPLIAMTPAMIPVMMEVCYALPAVYLPIVLTVAVLGMAVIAPYFGLLKPVLATAVSKLPKHTIRVEKVVTERIEGPKKGRFQEVTHKKVVNEKVEWRYRNRYGIIALGVLSAFLIIMFAVCPTHYFSTNIVNEFSYREAIKDNSVLFVWEQSGDTVDTADKKIRIYDQSAYKYFAQVDKDYSWNNSIKAYEKDFLGDYQNILDTGAPMIISVDGSDLKLTAFDLAGDSFVDLTLTNVSAVTEFTIDIGRDKIEVTNDGKNTINLQFPYDDNDYGSFTISFTIDPELNNGNEKLNMGVTFTQYVSGNKADLIMNHLSEYKDIESVLSSKSFHDDITCGLIFTRKGSFQIG